MAAATENDQEYDIPTAVTFLLIGLALGAVLTTLFGPSTDKSENQNLSAHQPRRTA